MKHFKIQLLLTQKYSSCDQYPPPKQIFEIENPKKYSADTCL